MKYISTRGYKHPNDNPQFTDILLEGLAPDGGLYLPETYPHIDLNTLNGFATLNYADLAFEVLSRFATDINTDDLKTVCHKTYTADVYKHARFDENTEDITPVRILGNEGGTQLALLGLSNGPTLAFKDMAMQFLGNMFEYALKKTGRTLNILGATSGDTGSAAEYAMRGKQGINVFMLSPHGKMSAFQQAQMFSLQDKNIFNIAMTGWFDDCQDVVKRVSEDLEFKRQYHIGAVNSINWGRIVAQVVYYFKGYLGTIAATKGVIGDTVDVCVPSGNFGNICAAHIARQMGLPLGKLIAATNENNVLDEFFRTGKYRVRNSSETLETTSPSMDISKASNFERFIFDLMGRDADKIQSLMRDVGQQGGFDLSQYPEFAQVAAQYGFLSGTSNHSQRMAVIKDIAGRYGVVIDTHTADGVKVAREHLRKNIPMLVLETALPIKFSKTIEQALQMPTPRPLGFEGLEALPKRFDVMEANVDAMKAYIQARVC
jgi:threonine synthase